MHRRLILGLCAPVFLALTPEVCAATKDSCPVTTAPASPFVPPAPYRAIPPPGLFWYGTNGLWTWLPTEGVWRSLTNKLFLWQEGYDVHKEPEPDIIVVLRRLDANMPLVASRGGTNAHLDDGWLMLTGLTFPSEGCWEITTYHAGHTLTFVASIQP